MLKELTLQEAVRLAVTQELQRCEKCGSRFLMECSFCAGNGPETYDEAGIFDSLSSNEA